MQRGIRMDTASVFRRWRWVLRQMGKENAKRTYTGMGKEALVR